MVDYKIVKTARRSVCILIKDGEVIVRAPHLTPKFIIEKLVREKSSWIEKHQKKKNFERDYTRDEQFLVLGKPHLLKIIVSEQEGVILDGANIRVNAISEKKDDIKRKVKKYFLTLTKNTVEKYLKKYKAQFRGPEKQAIFKFYKSKWGSCSAKNDLSFNVKLSMMPEKVIEYIVVHELVHTKHKNHSKNYWAEVGRFDLDYKSHRKWVRDNSDKMVL